MNGVDRIPEPFLDWYGIWPGAAGYEQDGLAWVGDAPRGVRLAVQPPQRVPFVLGDDRPWEEGRFNVEAMLHDQGRFRLWYSVTPPGWQKRALCYAESADGFHWEKPSLGLCEFAGTTANNILSPDIGGDVFRDTNPDVPETERYKMVCMVGKWLVAEPDADEARALEKRLELSIKGVSEKQIDLELGLSGEVVGAVSPDGIHWTKLEEPLLKMFCDCDNIVYYDQEARLYVGYFRHNMFRETVPTEWPPNPRRCVGRAETADFRHWPVPRIVLQPDSQDPPTDDFYTNAYSLYPGGKYRLMFPGIFHRVEDKVDVQLAVSRDGYTWTRPQRDPIIPLGPAGSGEDGSIYAHHGLFSLGPEQAAGQPAAPEAHWGLIYRGASGRHNEAYYYPHAREDSHWRWALWQPDRLVALEAAGEGQVTLLPQHCHGERLLLNYQTEPNGWIKVELIGPESLWPPRHVPAIAGYTFADCEPLRGDSLAGEVRWNGSADMAALKGRDLCLRVQMSRAMLFSVSL